MDAQATFSCSFTQSDLRPVAELPTLPYWLAQRLLPQQRQDLAVQVLTGAQPVSDLGSPQEIVYRDLGLMMRLHFGRDSDRSRRSAMGRKTRGKRRTPVS